MIICEKGKTAYKGTALDLQAELACIIQKFMNEGIIESEEELYFIVSTAIMNREDLDELAKTVYAELIINEVMSHKEDE